MGSSALENYATIAVMSKDSYGEGNIFLRGKTYWVQYSVNGHRRRESAKTTNEAKARKFLREKLTAAQGGALPRTKILIGELLDNLLRFYKQNRPKSYDWAVIVVNHLRPPFEYLKAVDLGTKHLSAYADARRALGRQNPTINREMAILRRAYSLGMRHEPPLVHRIPHIPELPENDPRSGFFEAADFDRLRAELPEDVRDVSTFAYWTGCRKSEILRLRWPQVDLEERMVRLQKTKNNEDRDIPLSGELFEVIERRRKDRDANWPSSPWVFSRDGQRIINFYTSWRSACERANLTGDADLLHDLRRTGVRNLIRAGVPEKVAMLISGHKTRAVFERYHIVKGEDVREAMEKLEKHLGKKK